MLEQGTHMAPLEAACLAVPPPPQFPTHMALIVLAPLQLPHYPFQSFLSQAGQRVKGSQSERVAELQRGGPGTFLQSEPSPVPSPGNGARGCSQWSPASATLQFHLFSRIQLDCNSLYLEENLSASE